MNRRKISTFLLAGMLSVSTVIGSTALIPRLTQTVHAATNNALGQDVNVSYDGKTVILGAYNIDGYNYFRIADIGSLLNFATTQEQVYLGTEYYIKMISKTPYGSAITPISTEKTKASVDLGTMKLQFDEYTGSIQRFNLNDRNYFKLGDIVAISKENYNSSISSVISKAKQGIGTTVSEGKTTTKLDTAYDSSTKTITITKTVTDLQQVYEEEYYQTFGADKFKVAFGRAYNKVGNVDTKKDTPPPTSSPINTPPEVGTFPAKILKDPSKGAYLGNGSPNWENYEKPYYQGSPGQCVWYATGRFEEVLGVMFPSISTYDLEIGSKESNLKVYTNPKDIVSKSIAVFGNQHVVFVEYVEHDANGNPLYIYFSEGNTRGNNKYEPTMDGKVKKVTYDNFLISVGTENPYKGCITIK